MTQTYSQFKTATLAVIQDASTVNFGSAEMDTFIANASREAGQYVPHIVKASFTIESRTGTATSTSAGNLVDSTESQFLAGDVGKDVYNTTTKTWATITGYTSATTVALSSDIMTSGDNYKIFNSGCSANNQISIANIDDYANIESVEYPVGTKRNWEIDGTVLTIKTEVVDDSKVPSSGTRPNTEVVVRFKKRHLISQLTDFAGVVAGTSVAVSATTMAMSSLQSAGTIEAGQEFTVANVRGVYTITADATIASNTVAVSFYPPIASAAATTTVVTLTQSTLTPTLEPLVQDLAVGLAAASKPMKLYQHSFDAVTAIGLTTSALTSVAGLISAATADASSARTALTAGITSILAMTAQITAATAHITSGTASMTLASSAVTAATISINLIDEQIALAASAMTVGYGLLNTIPVGGGAGEYMGQASGDMANAQANLMNGQGWLQKASAELNMANGYYNTANTDLRVSSEWAQQAGAYHTNASQYLNSAALSLRSAGDKISEGNASLTKAGLELRVVASGRTMEISAREKLADVRNRLRAYGGLPISPKRYTQE